MMTTLPSSNLLGFGTLAARLVLAAGCGSIGGHVAGSSAASSHSSISEDRLLERLPAPVDTSPSGTPARIGGDLTAKLAGSDAHNLAGACRVDTPRPVGYPAPTPPGSIDLKAYPSVRLAQVTGDGDPDSGMNKTFRPLFNHIKGHGIAMTSPVEMSYRGMQASDQSALESWTMAFLYRQPELHQTGVESWVVVRDSDPVTVVAVGMKGSYSMSLVQRDKRHIGDWFAANPQCEAAGDWRGLYYDGPALFWWNKWAKVQIPVRKSVGGQLTTTVGDGAGTGSDR